MTPHLDTLRAELERLYELEPLLDITRDLLGFDPAAVGGTQALGSYTRALVEHCLDHDAVEALCDVLFATRTGVDARLQQLRSDGFNTDDELRAGDDLAGWTVVRKLGEGRLGIAYVARKDGKEWRVKVLRSEAMRDRRGMQRFLTVSRLVGGIEHPGLPRGLFAGASGRRVLVAHEHIEGQPLSARIQRTGAMHLNEARPLLRSLLEALAAIHEKRLSHGDLRPENVILYRGPDGTQRVALVDAGSDRLRARPRVHLGNQELFSTVSSARTSAPEQLRGLPSDVRSDLYSFGAVAYEVLSGKLLFAEANTASELAVAHMTRAPAMPSFVAPRGWITKELDDFLLGLLAKDPAQRPASAQAVLEALDALGRATAQAAKPTLAEGELETRIDALVASPDSSEAALALEAAVEAGGDVPRIAEAFTMAADSVEVADEAQGRDIKKSLLFRAARLWEQNAQQPDKAEQVYLTLIELDPSDEIAVTALEDLRRSAGKYEELVEMLLARSEAATSREDRARALGEIGMLYAEELKDPEQAAVALTQAFCEHPEHDDYATQIEKVAGTDQARWAEVLTTCAGVLSADDLATDLKNPLLVKMGRWYAEKVSRPDLALPCYQGVLTTEPAHEGALEGMTTVYRKAQQWVELGMVLTRRADAAIPSRARDLRAEAAEILEVQLNDTGRARDLYEQILSEDPGHGRATDALARIYERTGDWSGYARLMERKAHALRGEDKHRALCRIAEVYEDRLRDDGEATRRYEQVLGEDGDNLDALRGLDRLYSKAGRYRELLENLERQVRLAATPRQRILLFERMAGIHDEEFLDHANAAAAWESVLAVDPAHEGALASLSRHYRALDRWEDVASLYERQLKLTTETPRMIELNLALGRVLGEQIGSPERATSAYERVISLDARHAGALEALARLRETSGDADAALSAIEALAEKAETPQARAEQFLRGARLLENRGNRDGAIEQYKRALDANPTDAAVGQALRAAYLARGDVNAAVQLLEREFDKAEGDRAKARISAEIATLCRERLKDDRRAEEAAKRATAFDPTNAAALVVLGDLAFEAKRYLEASRSYEVLADAAGSLDKAVATRVLERFVDSLAWLGSTEKAATAMDTLLRIAPDDGGALLRVARVSFDAGAHRRAAELYQDLLSRFPDQLAGPEKGQALYRYGEALRLTDQLDEARPLLDQASELDPSSADPLIALARLFEAKEQWEEAIRIKTRHLDLAEGEARIQLLLEIGEIAAGKLNDRTRAAKSFVAALDERPDDRRLLTRLMQLYSEEKDWSRLLDVVLRLADFVDDPRQKSKYVHTAAGIAARQMQDVDRAVEFYDRVIELDPTNEKALDESIELLRDHGRHEQVERQLRRRLDAATKADDKARILQTVEALGALYEKALGDMDRAIDAYEAAQALDPDDKSRVEHLAQLYASDPARYLEKAIAAQTALLRHNPHRAEVYKLLRRLYTEVKRADGAWCLCQALYVLNLAEPDEERFYKRMRAETAAAAQAVCGDDEWANMITHADTDPLLTAVFAAIEPAVIAARSQPLAALGYDPYYAVDLASHPYPMSQTLHYACGVLGFAPPPTFENTNDPGGLSFLHAQPPSIVLGLAALGAEVPPQAAAFIAARHVTYFRPGLYVRHLLPSALALKAWLFASIKMIVPQFPVAADMEGPVLDATRALEQHLTPTAKDHLASVVGRLLQSGRALDLRRWVAGVDLTADRAGFLLSHDLETAVEIIRASDESSSSVSPQERLKDLVLYAVSAQYVNLRGRLGVGIDA